MRTMVTAKLQVSCARKRWTIAIGNHRNLLLSYSRYPLEGTIDLGDFSNSDFKQLATFFGQRKANSKFISCNGKWLFEFNNHHVIKIGFNHHPFDGTIDLGELSPAQCKSLLEMFTQAQEL